MRRVEQRSLQRCLGGTCSSVKKRELVFGFKDVAKHSQITRQQTPWVGVGLHTPKLHMTEVSERLVELGDLQLISLSFVSDSIVIQASLSYFNSLSV
jgi:hypothetical protein